MATEPLAVPSTRTGEYPGYTFAAGKAGGYDIRKCSDNQQQYEPCKNGEKHLAAMANVLLNNLSQGFSLMTDGYEDGAEVLNSPEENTADNQSIKIPEPSRTEPPG